MFPETLFWRSQQNTAVAVKKMYVEKNRKCMKICGLFEHGKKVFFVLFGGFNGFVVLLVCV